MSCSYREGFFFFYKYRYGTVFYTKYIDPEDQFKYMKLASATAKKKYRFLGKLRYIFMKNVSIGR